ncbi:leucine-rich repeat-containing protein [Klebsormidium nitens]|uniref:Leucine-rich repeat-containing protein n=1 Tax=Klebsormidium nitens TaxID=105231 RepID=A0A1Y1I5M2_KLENI|nr:leucine-rich repeat-containing protein [Klebsormidium nitens]|eukprot:GAQ86260.1 leucine-rich repeat-containing protein [Klebsormidium nitens]
MSTMSASLGVGPGGSTSEMKTALEELRLARQKLRPRPSPVELAEAQAALVEGDKQLISDLEQLMLAPRPPELEAAQFASLQALRESRLRKAAELAQRAPLAVLELDEQHRHYDHLIMSAERALFANPQATKPPAPLNPEGVAAEPVAEPEWQDKQQVGANPLPTLQMPQRGEDTPGPALTGVPMLSHHKTTSGDQSGKATLVPAAEPAVIPNGQQGEGGPRVGENRAAASAGAAPVREVPEEKLPRLLAQAATSSSTCLDLSAEFAHELDFFPDTLPALPALMELSLAENRLPELPAGIGALPGLVRLEAQFNRLAELPSTLGGLTALTHLDLRSNCLEELPPALGRCARLRYLNVASNKLPALPEAIGALAGLETLVASLNHLRGLPAAIGGCTALTCLDVHYNEIRDVPEALGECRRLRQLDLGSNFAELRALPASLGQLSCLQTLTLSQNSLRALPISLGRLAQLKVLALEGNPLRYPPKAVVAAGTDAVLAFLAQQAAAAEADAAAAAQRGPLRKVWAKLRRKPKDLARQDSLDDLKRLA